MNWETICCAHKMEAGEDIDALYRKMRRDYHGQKILEDDFSMLAVHLP